MDKQTKYQDAITDSMIYLSFQKDIIFLGENIINAGRIYGTLNNVPLDKCIEMPVAENLIVGSAIGLALAGFKPIVIFIRMDFMLICADAIINHLALINKMSGGKIKVPVILRTIIGSQILKFEMGPQHKHDFRHIFRPYIKVIDFKKDSYFNYKWDKPVMIVEKKDDYERFI